MGQSVAKNRYGAVSELGPRDNKSITGPGIYQPKEGSHNQTSRAVSQLLNGVLSSNRLNSEFHLIVSTIHIHKA